MMKRWIACLCAALLALGLSGCGMLRGTEGTMIEISPDAYVVGICRTAEDPAQDEAAQGYMDALVETFGEKHIVFEEQTGTDAGAMVADFARAGADAVFVDTTAALQAAAAVKTDMPVFGTDIREYIRQLGIQNFNGAVGGNVTGAADFAPQQQLASMITVLVPEAETVGILYCPEEFDSAWQVEVMLEKLDDLHFAAKTYPFHGADDAAAAAAEACTECDAIYIPADAAAAACAGEIGSVTLQARVPVFCGDEAMCKGLGVGTLSVSSYERGYATGLMTADVLRGDETVSGITLACSNTATRKYDPELCRALDITVPEAYTPLA